MVEETADWAPEDEPREEKIRRRAYELYVERGYMPGYDVEDWIQAEQELSSEAEPLHDKALAAGADS